MTWTIEWENDVGGDDEYYVEWLTVSDGTRSFKADTREDAEYLRDLAQQVEDLQKDAARYRWLKDERHYDGWYPDYYDGRGKGRHEWTLWSEIADLDAAIDEAMK